jgi:hypothetical protein
VAPVDVKDEIFGFFLPHACFTQGGDVLIQPFEHTDLRICVDGRPMIVSFQIGDNMT